MGVGNVNIAAELRTAIVADATVQANVSSYIGSYAVFTSRPAPDDATYPLVMIGGDVTGGNEDGVNDSRPLQTHDIAIYNKNDRPADFRTVETIAYAVYTLFHREPGAIAVSGWQVVEILARGPIVAPSDDDQIAGLIVELTISLAKHNP